LSQLFVNGTLMRGLELNGNLLDCGGSFVREAKTAPVYRLYSIDDVHPAMLRAESGGAAIALEIWELPAAGLARVLAGEPAGLCIGQVALNDDEFGTVLEGMGWALVASILLVLALLFAALRSFKLIAACFLTLIVGLVLTFGFATVAIGSLNLVSIAFAVMFIGLSIDFGIQLGVRYGQERFIADDDTALGQDPAQAGSVGIDAGHSRLGIAEEDRPRATTDPVTDERRYGADFRRQFGAPGIPCDGPFRQRHRSWAGRRQRGGPGHRIIGGQLARA